MFDNTTYGADLVWFRYAGEEYHCEANNFNPEEYNQFISRIDANWFTYKNSAHWLNGDTFENSLEAVQKHVDKVDFDSKNYSERKANGELVYHKVWYVKIDVDLKTFKVTYTNINASERDRLGEHHFSFDYVTRERDLPKIERKHYNLNWKYNGNFVTKLPGLPTDITVNAVWTEKMYYLQYEVYPGIDNPNEPITFTFKDGVINILPIPDTTHYHFVGWKNGDNIVTSIECANVDEDITLVASFEFTKYHAIYYVDGDVYKDLTFDMTDLDSYQEPVVPEKAHYHAVWNDNVTELKNYSISAIYTAEIYTVRIVTNIYGYTIPDQQVTYGGTYAPIYDLLHYDEKYLLGLYTDGAFKNRVSEGDLVEKDITLYAKWETIFHISTVEDWNKIVQNPSSGFMIDSDINFKGDPIPLISDFSGTIDGQNHKIYNAMNSDTSCSQEYGIITRNRGTIKNITFSEISFVAGNSATGNAPYIGFICAKNYGTFENVKIEKCGVNITPYNYFSGGAYMNVDQYAGVIAYNEGTVSKVVVDEDSDITIKSKTLQRNVLRYDDSYMNINASSGGIVGYNKGTITHSEFNGDVLHALQWEEQFADYYADGIRSNRYRLRLGGIVGLNEGSVYLSEMNGYLNPSIAVPSLRHSFDPHTRIGGIAGSNKSRLENCYTSESASIYVYSVATNLIGGIAGHNEENSTIVGCLTKNADYTAHGTGSSSSYVGGLAGYNDGAISYSGASTTYCKFKNVSSNSVFGGAVGECSATSSMNRVFSLFDSSLIDSDSVEILHVYFAKQGVTSSLMNSYAYVDEAVRDHFEKYSTVTQVDDRETMLSTEMMYGNLHLDDRDILANGTDFPTIPGVGA